MATIADPSPAGPTSEEQIAEFEKYVGRSLPDDYRRFLLTHNGGHPVPDAFTVTIDEREEEDVVMCFFPLRDLALGKVEVEAFEELRIWPLHCAWDDLQHDLVHLYELELDETLLPIGTDGGSNYFCVVLDGPRRGAVLFFEHEMAEQALLADSFSGFLDSLRPGRR